MTTPALALCQKPVWKMSAELTVTLIINSISLAGIILGIFLICDNWQKIKNKIKNLFFGYFSGV